MRSSPTTIRVPAAGSSPQGLFDDFMETKRDEYKGHKRRLTELVERAGGLAPAGAPADAQTLPAPLATSVDEFEVALRGADDAGAVHAAARCRAAATHPVNRLPAPLPARQQDCLQQCPAGLSHTSTRSSPRRRRARWHASRKASAPPSAARLRPSRVLPRHLSHSTPRERARGPVHAAPLTLPTRVRAYVGALRGLMGATLTSTTSWETVAITISGKAFAESLAEPLQRRAFDELIGELSADEAREAARDDDAAEAARADDDERRRHKRERRERRRAEEGEEQRGEDGEVDGSSKKRKREKREKKEKRERRSEREAGEASEEEGVL